MKNCGDGIAFEKVLNLVFLGNGKLIDLHRLCQKGWAVGRCVNP